MTVIFCDSDILETWMYQYGGGSDVGDVLDVGRIALRRFIMGRFVMGRCESFDIM
jgi:hypothetical protein